MATAGSSVTAEERAPPPDAAISSRVVATGVAAAKRSLGLRPAGGPDVDPQVLDLGDLVPVVLVHDVDGLLAHHPGHRPLSAQQPHPLPHEHLLIPPADRVEADEAFIVDVA